MNLKPTKPFKGLNNAWYTRSLFIELFEEFTKEIQSEAPIYPPFSLTEERTGFVCFRTSFVELGDPTGYQWAMKYLGSWLHWQKLLKCKWFQEALEIALVEMNAKLKSESFAQIQAISQSGTPQSITAARYLHDIATKGKGAARGRPSKEEMTGELKRRVDAVETEDEDLKRIGLKVINGGKE